MSECKCDKKTKEEKDDLQYVNVDQLEPSNKRDLDEDSPEFLRFDDMQDKCNKKK